MVWNGFTTTTSNNEYITNFKVYKINQNINKLT
jgi:hypothetical protein